MYKNNNVKTVLKGAFQHNKSSCKFFHSWTEMKEKDQYSDKKIIIINCSDINP